MHESATTPANSGHISHGGSLGTHGLTGKMHMEGQGNDLQKCSIVAHLHSHCSSCEGIHIELGAPRVSNEHIKMRRRSDIDVLDVSSPLSMIYDATQGVCYWGHASLPHLCLQQSCGLQETHRSEASPCRHVAALLSSQRDLHALAHRCRSVKKLESARTGLIHAANVLTIERLTCRQHDWDGATNVCNSCTAILGKHGG